MLLCRQIGLDSGDGEHYYVLPDHGKPSADRIELTTNVGKLGRWFFRVDGIDVIHGAVHGGGFNVDKTDIHDAGL